MLPGAMNNFSTFLGVAGISRALDAAARETIGDTAAAPKPAKNVRLAIRIMTSLPFPGPSRDRSAHSQ
jgi:hypothetical protein